MYLWMINENGAPLSLVIKNTFYYESMKKFLFQAGIKSESKFEAADLTKAPSDV